MSSPTVSIELSKDELSDIRIALMEYRSKWFGYHMEELDGAEKWKGAGSVYNTVANLQLRFIEIADSLDSL